MIFRISCCQCLSLGEFGWYSNWYSKIPSQFHSGCFKGDAVIDYAWPAIWNLFHRGLLESHQVYILKFFGNTIFSEKWKASNMCFLWNTLYLVKDLESIVKTRESLFEASCAQNVLLLRYINFSWIWASEKKLRYKRIWI